MRLHGLLRVRLPDRGAGGAGRAPDGLTAQQPMNRAPAASATGAFLCFRRRVLAGESELPPDAIGGRYREVRPATTVLRAPATDRHSEDRVTYVITEPCIGTKDASCVAVCPVDCIYERDEQYVIHPDECIDCGACEPECPVTAIFPDGEVPPAWSHYIARNRELAEPAGSGS